MQLAMRVSLEDDRSDGVCVCVCVFVYRSPRPQLNFNSFDRDCHVDRRSKVKDYAVIDGIPRNPVCRTGMTGRGVLT